MSKPQSILPHILLRVLPAFILILLVIWFSARAMTNRAIRQEINERLATQANQAAQATAKKLNTLIDTVKGLSMNNLVVNGLIDIGDRVNYLPTFFQSLRIPGPTDAIIAMTDYRGRHIVTNTGEPISYTNAPWLKTVMTGNHHFEISAGRLQIAMPILYAGLPEGVLAVSCKPVHISKFLALTSQTSAFAILDKNEIVLFSSDAALGKIGVPYAESKREKWIEKREPVPDITGLSLICAEPYQKAFGASKRLDQYLLLAMILNLTALVAGVFLSAQLTAKPLSTFIKKIDQVGHACDLDCTIPEVGVHEFQLLAKSFNNMLQDLQKTTVSRDDLELRVKERTHELEEAQKELVNKAMDAGWAQLAAMVMHNIGNAITPIIVQMETMKTNESEQIIRYMEKCYHELNTHSGDLKQHVNDDPRGKEVFEYLGKLIDSIGEQIGQNKDAYKKIEGAISYIAEVISLQQAYAAGQQETRERVNLNNLIEDAIRMQMGTIEKRGIKIRRDLDKNISNLMTDKSKLIQVINNFIKNSYEAIDEIRDGNQEKWIAFKSFADGRYVGFEISDNGIGIDPAHLENIVEFGESSKGSTGFGLYYCKMFVEANNGTLSITSPGKGKGTTVRVEFAIRTQMNADERG